VHITCISWLFVDPSTRWFILCPVKRRIPLQLRQYFSNRPLEPLGDRMSRRKKRFDVVRSLHYPHFDTLYGGLPSPFPDTCQTGPRDQIAGFGGLKAVVLLRQRSPNVVYTFSSGHLSPLSPFLLCAVVTHSHDPQAPSPSCDFIFPSFPRTMPMAISAISLARLTQPNAASSIQFIQFYAACLPGRAQRSSTSYNRGCLDSYFTAT